MDDRAATAASKPRKPSPTMKRRERASLYRTLRRVFGIHQLRWAGSGDYKRDGEAFDAGHHAYWSQQVTLLPTSGACPDWPYCDRVPVDRVDEGPGR